MPHVHRGVVGRDLTIGPSNVTVGLLVAGGVGISPGWWWVGATAAIGAGVLSAASDRSRTGRRLLVAGVVLATAFVVWVWYARPVPFTVVPFVVVGMGVGSSLDRFVSGVVRDVPPARIRRKRAG